MDIERDPTVLGGSDGCEGEDANGGIKYAWPVYYHDGGGMVPLLCFGPGQHRARYAHKNTIVLCMSLFKFGRASEVVKYNTEDERPLTNPSHEHDVESKWPSF